jgi:hypothetical protein
MAADPRRASKWPGIDNACRRLSLSIEESTCISLFMSLEVIACSLKEATVTQLTTI